MPAPSASPLRVATLDDAEKIAPLVNDAYRGTSQSWTHESDLVRGPRIAAQEIRQRVTAPGSAILVASRGDGHLVGCVHVEARGSAGYIGLLSVDPDAQNARAGSGLMRGAEAYVRESLGLAHAVVWVIDARPELRAWYERLGYVATGETLPFPADEALVAGMSFVVLRKPLG
jgi:N-acetylglutamate synthase-like GNAT family acetyltransferase